MKQFKHNFVEQYDLQTETIDGKRHYILPDGVTKLKSVTTVLSEKLDKTSLLEWRKKVGDEEADRISRIAARRGTAIHDIAEKYVLNDPDYLKGAMPINAIAFRPLEKALQAGVDNVRGVEAALFSRVLGCAGRADLIADYYGTTSIIDYKTSTRPKEEDWILNYFLQTTIYSMMFEAIYKIPVPQIVVIITVDHEKEAQIFVKQRSKYVKQVLELFEIF